jgi:predicted proteasome-type protease
MPTYNIGKHLKTSTEEQQDGMQISKNTTMKSNMYQGKPTYQQMYYPNHLEWIKEKKTINKSQYYLLIASSMQ